MIKSMKNIGRKTLTRPRKKKMDKRPAKKNYLEWMIPFRINNPMKK